MKIKEKIKKIHKTNAKCLQDLRINHSNFQRRNQSSWHPIQVEKHEKLDRCHDPHLRTRETKRAVDESLATCL